MQRPIDCLLPVLALLAAPAVNAHADAWVCSAQCAVIDTVAEQVVVLGNATGSSTCGTAEAWADLEQDCVNLKTAAGFGRATHSQLVQSLMFRNQVTRETLEISASSGSGGAEIRVASFLGGLFTRMAVGWGFHYESYSWSACRVSRDFSVEFTTPNPSGCAQPVALPTCEPKYVGPGRPMG